MGRSCIIGGGSNADILTRGEVTEAALIWQNGKLWCEYPGELEADGEVYLRQAPVSLNSRIVTESLSMALEPMTSSTPTPEKELL